MLEFRNLSIRVGGKRLLTGLSGNLPEGKIVGLVAPNGSGKTTFMRALIGADDISTTGDVLADGIRIERQRDYRRLVYYVPGDASILYPLLTVRENLLIIARCWESESNFDRIVSDCGISAFMNVRVRRLSMGMKQQVSLAAGYMARTKYLLLDEPMNALDPTNLETNSRIIRSLAERGFGILMSSHILSSVDDLADEVVFIKNERLVRSVNSDDGVAAMYKRLYG